MTRALVKSHRTRGKRYFFSKLNGCDVHPDTLLERNYALRLEFRNEIESYCCQPETAHYQGSQCSPDFLIKYVTGTSEYVEVHRDEMVDDIFREKIRAFNRYFLATSQRPFILVRDTDMCVKETENLNFLYDYRGIDWPHTLSALPTSLTYAQLIEYCAQKLTLSQRDATITALTLLADKRYVFDFSKILNTHTQLTLSDV